MLSDFQFNGVNLKEINFVTNDEFEKNTDENFEENVTFETKIGRAEGEENSALVELTINIGGTESPYCIEITMRSIFRWNKTMENEMAEVLLQTNAPALLLSYARPIIANLTMNGRFKTINIPYIDFTQNLQEE